MIKFLAIPLLAFALIPPKCQTTPPPPPPANVASAPALATATEARMSKLSAHAEAADVAADKIAEPLVRTSVKGPLSVVRSLAGPATDADRAAALALVVQAQAGKLDAANAGFATARADAAALTTRLRELETIVAAERAAAAGELQRQLAAARDEARRAAVARERTLKTMIFFGLGAALCLAAVASVFLRAYLPFLGPNVTVAIGAGGVMLLLLGIVTRAIERLIDDHPYIFWGGLLFTVCALVGAVALIFANHHHAKEAPA